MLFCVKIFTLKEILLFSAIQIRSRTMSRLIDHKRSKHTKDAIGVSRRYHFHTHKDEPVWWSVYDHQERRVVAESARIDAYEASPKGTERAHKHAVQMAWLLGSVDAVNNLEAAERDGTAAGSAMA